MSAHAEFLRAASDDVNLASNIKADFRRANLSEQDFTMLEFVEKLTLFPWLVVESDIVGLRRAGFNDSQILHIVLGSAHFNYLNRMADGLGIHFEYVTHIPVFKIQDQTLELTSAPSRGLLPRQKNAIAWIRCSGGGAASSDREPRHLYQVMSGNQPVSLLARSWRQYQLGETKELSLELRVQLALFISAMNHCDYSVYWFERLAIQLGFPETIRRELASGLVPKSTGDAARQYFSHAHLLTQQPWKVTRGFIDDLRRAGLNDHGILQLTMLCSYLSFENRIALGLGVALEAEASIS